MIFIDDPFHYLNPLHRQRAVAPDGNVRRLSSIVSCHSSRNELDPDSAALRRMLSAARPVRLRYKP